MAIREDAVPDEPALGTGGDEPQRVWRDRAMPHASTASDSGTCLYEMLQVSPRAKPEVIHAAYRVLVRDHHPDVNQAANADAYMRRLNAAHDILTDPGRRAQYDAGRAQASRRASARRAADATRRQSRLAVVPAQPPVARSGGAAVLVYVVTAGVAICAALALLILLWTLFDASDGPAGGFPTSKNQPNSVMSGPIIVMPGGTTGGTSWPSSTSSCPPGRTGAGRAC